MMLSPLRTHLRHALLHGGRDLLDEHAQARRGGHAPEHEGGEADVRGQVRQHVHPVIARADDLLILVAQPGLGDRGDIAADVVDAADGGRVAAGGAGRLVNDRVRLERSAGRRKG